jgi:site-specific DNA-methyltransferase (adenine-specific)
MPRISDVILGDFRDRSKFIKDGSVSLVLTDPPYDPQSLDLYGDVAAFAARVLTPDGLCMVYAGKMYLPSIMDRMSQHLRYLWTMAAVFQGAARGIRSRGFLDSWRPILVFGKDSFRPWWSAGQPTMIWPRDVLDFPAEKDHHEWQQSLAEAEKLVDQFTLPDQLVVDPMCGTGTTLVAAKNLDRECRGFEVDAEQVATARQRLGE